MATQNKKFTTILLAGLVIGGAVALGYACGGDDTTGAIEVPKVDGGTPGAGGSAGSAGGGTGGTAGAGTGGTAGGGTGGTAGGGTGGGDGGGAMPCQASGTFDNVKAKTVFPADGGVPMF